jgi:uncharacterized membrane protein YheB (UPF0754 family)
LVKEVAQMELIYIISPIVGAVIGYLTNWIAIKMLFRPLKKIYIGPIALPFTPGLIPKERQRIARSIADAVGQNLLSPDLLASEAVSEDKLHLIEGFLDKKLIDLKTSDKTLGDVLELLGVTDTGLDRVIAVLVQKVTAKEFADQYIDDLTSWVKGLGTKLGESEAVTGTIASAVTNSIAREDRSLKEVLPGEVLEKVPSWTDSISQSILKSIEDYLEKPSAEELFKKHIDGFLAKGPLRNLLGMLLDTSLISRQLVGTVLQLVKDPETKLQVFSAVESGINELLEKKPQEVLAAFGEGEVDKAVSSGLKLLFSERTVDTFCRREYLEKLITSPEIGEKIAVALKRAATKAKGMRIQSIYRLYGDGNWQELKKKVLSVYKKKAPDLLVRVFSEFNLTKIIEDKINTFDLLELENLIFGISKRELGAITWLGGLLGFLMGLLTPLINALLL